MIKCKAQSLQHLKEIIRVTIEEEGETCDLNFIDISNVSDMTELFSRSQFNGDISKWNVSHVENMKNMFANSQFNGDISRWNVQNVKNMHGMFKSSYFKGNISKWDVHNVTDMSDMFSESVFDNDISRWNVSSVTNMKGMFHESWFHGDISKWNVSNVTNMQDLFSLSEFNGDISKWNVSRVTNMKGMFKGCPFNNDISKWDVHNVTDMECMFFGSDFDGNISQWNVSNVKNMNGMFMKSAFNGDISGWDVSNVTDMRDMFAESVFNKDISKWNVSNVIKISRIFKESLFNKDISNWNLDKAASNINFDTLMKWAFSKPLSNDRIKKVLFRLFDEKIFLDELSALNEIDSRTILHILFKEPCWLSLENAQCILDFQYKYFSTLNSITGLDSFNTNFCDRILQHFKNGSQEEKEIYSILYNESYFLDNNIKNIDDYRNKIITPLKELTSFSNLYINQYDKNHFHNEKEAIIHFLKENIISKVELDPILHQDIDPSAMHRNEIGLFIKRYTYFLINGE